MFARLKETIRILTAPAPAVVNGPDAVIVEKPKKYNAPAFGKVVAFLVEAFVCIYVIGVLASYLGGLVHSHPLKSVSLTTIVGALGAVLFWLGHQMIIELQVLLKKRLNIAERLAPYFGHKVEETYRILKG